MNEFSHHIDKHAGCGWDYVHLQCVDGDTGKERAAVELAPEGGANLFGFSVDGTDYIVDFTQEAGQELLGSPVLYPTPNRVRNATFEFEGDVFTFAANDGTNFLHGLVKDSPWVYDEPVVADDGICVTTRIAFEPGTEIFRRFPIRNTLEIKLTLRPDSIRYDFTVTNSDEKRRLPHGLAIHPYFPIIGPRESIRIQVPATQWMEAENLLPTGRLLDLQDGPADMREPTPLSELDLDDVFWGMESRKPATIFYDSIGKKVTLTASEFFTHAVVYCPPDKSFFCLENQTCSTDAHNLYNRGLTNEAHLSILNPGTVLTEWIEIKVVDIR